MLTVLAVILCIWLILFLLGMIFTIAVAVKFAKWIAIGVIVYLLYRLLCD